MLETTFPSTMQPFGSAVFLSSLLAPPQYRISATAPWQILIGGDSCCSEAKLLTQTPVRMSWGTLHEHTVDSQGWLFLKFWSNLHFGEIKTQAVWSQLWPFKLLQVNLWLRAKWEGIITFCERSQLWAQRVTTVMSLCLSDNVFMIEVA